MTPQNIAAFVKRLADIDRSKRLTEVFRDFCEMAYCSLAKQACPFPDQADKLEANYMEVVARYRNKADIAIMPELMAMALIALNGGGGDFLGSVAAEIGALDSGLGQFFTPYDISRLMAEMNLTEAPEIITREGFLTLSEPAAGAGGMVLAAADVIEGKGFCPARNLWVEAVELNRATFHMAYIQISARGIAGQVICGNSLSLDVYERVYTAAAPQFLAANGHPFAKQRAAAKAQDIAACARVARAESQQTERMLAPAPQNKPKQLSLFD